MRYIKILLSLIIGLIGTVLYFVSMPSIDEHKMIDMTVEAGDDSLLEDLYLSGYMTNYSSFILDADGVSIYEELSFLEQLDTMEYAELAMLQQAYPEFMENLLFAMNTYSFGLSTDEEYLVAGSMNQNPDSYLPQFQQLTVQVLNKETGEISEDIIEREDFPTGDSIDFLGVYQDYPTVKLLVNTGTWDRETYEETAKISLIAFNLETKDYSEETISKEEGYMYSYEHGSVSTNRSLVSVAFAPNYEDTMFHLFDFTNDSFHKLGEVLDHFIISEDNQLYSLTYEAGRPFLNHFNIETMEIMNQTELAHEGSGEIAREFPEGMSFIADDKLYLAESQFATDRNATADIPPSTLSVFDIETGEQLLQTTIRYDLENQSTTFEAFIENMGLLSKF